MDGCSLNISEPNLAVLEELISAVRTSHDEVDAWVATVRDDFPVVQDRGFQAASGGDSQRNNLSCRWEMRQQAILRNASWMSARRSQRIRRRRKPCSHAKLLSTTQR